MLSLTSSDPLATDSLALPPQHLPLLAELQTERLPAPEGVGGALSKGEWGWAGWNPSPLSLSH